MNTAGGISATDIEFIKRPAEVQRIVASLPVFLFNKNLNKKPCNILLKQVGYNGIIKIIRYEKSDIDDTRKQQ